MAINFLPFFFPHFTFVFDWWFTLWSTILVNFSLVDTVNVWLCSHFIFIFHIFIFSTFCSCSCYIVQKSKKEKIYEIINFVLSGRRFKFIASFKAFLFFLVVFFLSCQPLIFENCIPIHSKIWRWSHHNSTPIQLHEYLRFKTPSLTKLSFCVCVYERKVQIGF